MVKSTFCIRHWLSRVVTRLSKLREAAIKILADIRLVRLNNQLASHMEPSVFDQPINSAVLSLFSCLNSQHVPTVIGLSVE